MRSLLLAVVLSLCVVVLAAKRPNIVLVLTDDQDLLLGGVTPVKQVQNLIANEGVAFTNAFVSTPICCPSRSSILTGLYMHRHKTVNNSWSGGCSGPAWQSNLEPHTFGSRLHENGYRTFYAGKYLNAYGYKEAGGTKHVPKCWDWWMGLVGNSRYYNYTLSVNGTARHFTDQYLTNVIQNYSIEFLESVRNAPESFLMVLAPPAPHTPYTPEPKFRGHFSGIKVPRTPNFNTPKLKNRHWLVNMEPSPLPQETVALIDSYQALRWESLLSVDDMVAATVKKLQDIGQLDNTYIIYTSDHGYHLGHSKLEVAWLVTDDDFTLVVWSQFYLKPVSDVKPECTGHYAMPWDKRQPYETDIRVPLFVRGPGIPPKSLQDAVVVNIDIAPTIVDMAGLIVPLGIDGWSFLPYATHSPFWPPRKMFSVQYIGEGDRNTVSSDCPLNNDNSLSECYPTSSCKCQDSRNNTYDCMRHLDLNENSLYCEFYEELTWWGGRRGEALVRFKPLKRADLSKRHPVPLAFQNVGGHREYYDLNQDPFQLNNVFHRLSPSRQADLRNKLSRLHSCTGPLCSIFSDK